MRMSPGWRANMAAKRRRVRMLGPAARQALFERLRAAMPEPATELTYGSTYQLLVSVILSAQATDKSVNLATGPLFRVAGTPKAMVALGEPGLAGYIRTIGLWRMKAKHILEASRTILAQHGGEVPRERAALEALPGVGRKTANVLLGSWFDRPAIPVDTHVIRVSGRLGLTRSTDPVEIEQDLAAILPERDWTFTSSALIWHGRRVCYARNPECERCALLPDCPFGNGRLGDRFAILPAAKTRGGGPTKIASGGAVPKHRR